MREITEAHALLDAMKSEFVSGISHELRTPLPAIHGALEMLADGDAGPLPGSAQDVMALAHRGTQRLARLVGDIIDIERLIHGTFSFRPRPQPLAPLLDAAVGPLVSIARDRGITLTLEPTTQLAHLDGDRVIRAVVNLVGNALKFTPSLEAIFERFRQVRAEDDRSHSGAGLGLTITQHIVAAHGGRVWAENNATVGSTFYFTLPQAHPVEAQMSSPGALDSTSA